MLFGIDVSHYQEEIDWKRVEASGVKFALLKASEGSDFVDPMRHENSQDLLGGYGRPPCPRRQISADRPF